MKRINVTFEVENDLAEFNLRNVLEGMGGMYIKTLPNTEHLKDDKYFIKFKNNVKNAKEDLYRYINNNR